MRGIACCTGGGKTIRGGDEANYFGTCFGIGRADAGIEEVGLRCVVNAVFLRELVLAEAAKDRAGC